MRGDVLAHASIDGLGLRDRQGDAVLMHLLQANPLVVQRDRELWFRLMALFE
jgi:hypothetical protein